jgi:hypothetical protein
MFIESMTLKPAPPPVGSCGTANGQTSTASKAGRYDKVKAGVSTVAPSGDDKLSKRIVGGEKVYIELDLGTG